MGLNERGLHFLKNRWNMIVFNRKLQKTDFDNIIENDDYDDIIYYLDNNVAYVINKINKKYIVRRYKIFNRQLVDERMVKTIEQVLKVCV